MSRIRITPTDQISRMPADRVIGREPLPWEPAAQGGDVGGVGSGGSSVLLGVNNLSTANYWASPANQGSGHVVSTTHGVLIRLDATTDADRCPFGRFNSSTGWAVYAKIAATNPGPAFFGGTTRIGDFGVLTAGLTYLLVGTSDSGSVVRAYRNNNRVMVESSTAAGTFAASNAASETGIGCLPNAGTPIQGATGVTVLGAISLSTQLVLADIQAWFNLIVAGAAFVPPLTGTVVNHWVAGDAGATWVDRVGGVVLTRNGSPVTGVAVAPVWA